MAVDYREVNQFLKVSANPLPYQDMLFQLGGQLYYAKVDNLSGYHQLKQDQKSSRVTAIISSWVCILSHLAPSESFISMTRSFMEKTK